MNDLVHRAFEAYQQLIADIARSQGEAIRRAAKLCADCLSRQGVIHIYDTGHLVSRELINRVGGLAAMSPLNFSLSVENPNQFRQAQGETGKGGFETDALIVSAALKRSHAKAGDVLIIGTVSGKQTIPVELAIQAKDHGLTTIGITSLRCSHRSEMLVGTLAVASGRADGLVWSASRAGAGAIVMGGATPHDMMLAEGSATVIVDVGYKASVAPGLRSLCRQLQNTFAGDAEVVYTE